jgi:hypothetical protein
MYLFDTLNKAGGDYNKAWAEISGYWGISWFDGKALYLQQHNADVHFARYGNVWYYSSDDDHLTTAAGYSDKVIRLGEGETYKFVYKNGVVECSQATEFEATATGWTRGGYNGAGTGYLAGYRGYADNDNYGAGRWSSSTNTATSTWKDKDGDAEPKDWDADWRDAWAKYTTESEHAAV